MSRRNVEKTPRRRPQRSEFQRSVDELLDNLNRNFDAAIERAERLERAGAIDLEVERGKRRRQHAGE